MMLPLVLLLFARPYDIPLVSDTLERHAIYLEHPPSYNPLMHNGSRYSNPHNPAPGVSGRGGEAERRRQQMMSGMYGGAGLGATRSVKTQDVQREHVNAVFKDLKSGPDLDEVDPREFALPCLE
jgi:SWI/SNF-related matrix-associated actin-dependent regulator of chromatin subfamily A3